MVDILHKVGILSSPDDVYSALTTVDGLAGWWTDDTRGNSDVGGDDRVPLPARRFRHEGDRARTRPAGALARDRRARRMDRHDGQLGPQAGGRLHHRPVQTPGLEGTGRLHAPLQHEVGGLPAEPEVARRDREGRTRRRAMSRSTAGTERSSNEARPGKGIATPSPTVATTSPRSPQPERCPHNVSDIVASQQPVWRRRFRRKFALANERRSVPLVPAGRTAPASLSASESTRSSSGSTGQTRPGISPCRRSRTGGTPRTAPSCRLRCSC